MSNDKGDQKFLKGAVILAGAGIMIKVLGAVFRIPLTNWIGDGMAYYSVAYVIYGALVVIGTAGVPVAVSRLVSESIARDQYRNAHKIFHVATLLLLAVGTTCFVVCFFGADLIAKMVGSPKSALALRAMAPALFFVPLFSSFRGFFNGRQNMNPTAISEIMEQLVRCAVGLSLAFMFSHPASSMNTVKAAAGASFGASAGAIAGLLVIFLIFLANHKAFRAKIERGDQTVEEGKELAKKITLIAVPIIIGCEIMPIMTMIDTGIVMNVLKAHGWTQAQSEHLYSLYGGYCNPIIAFPQIFTQAVAVSLVPAISKHFGVGNLERTRDTVRLGYRTTMIMAFPCAIGLLVLAEPALKLLYFRQPESCHDAAPIMMILAVAIIFLAHMQTSTSVLQSVGKQLIPVRNLAIGCVGKVIVCYILVGIHVVNVKGAAISTMLAYIVAMVLNDICVKKYTGVTHNVVQTYVKPFIAAAIMGAWALGCYEVLVRLLAGHSAMGANALACGIAILTSMAVYAVCIFAVKAITVEEMEEGFPGGAKLAKIVRKFVR